MNASVCYPGMFAVALKTFQPLRARERRHCSVPAPYADAARASAYLRIERWKFGLL